VETQTEKVDIQEQVQREIENYGLTEIEPIEPKEKVKFRFKRRREREYYHSINWADWWDEFNGARTEGGKRKYLSVGSFIQSKTKVHWQQQMLSHCIGQEPAENTVREVPYLGNWQKIRRNGFYVFDDPAKARAVEIALEQKSELVAATRALAPMIAKRLAYWYKIKDMITDALVGKLVEEDTYATVKLKGGKSKKVLVETRDSRLDSFFKWQQKAEQMILKLEDQWMKIHGVDPTNPGQNWITMGELAGKVGAAAALTGAAASSLPGRPMILQNGEELPLPEGVNYDSLLFASHLVGHAERFPELPLPEEVKANGKHKSKAQ